MNSAEILRRLAPWRRSFKPVDVQYWTLANRR